MQNSRKKILIRFPFCELRTYATRISLSLPQKNLVRRIEQAVANIYN